MPRKRTTQPAAAPKPDLDALLSALDHADSAVRQSAVQALGRSTAPEATAALIRALADPDPDVRAWSAGMLGGVDNVPGRPEAVGPLIGALQDEDPAVRGHVAISLGLLRDHRAAAALMSSLSDPHPGVRGHAAYALGSVGASEAIPLLAVALRDPEPLVRVWSATALRNLHWDGRTPMTDHAVPALIEALADGDARVREKAAYALGTIGDPKAVDGLLALLDDEEPLVRHAAIDALGQIGDARALAPLQHVAAHDDGATFLGSLRDAATQVIAWLSSLSSDGRSGHGRE